jgi:hypothetical protein
MWYDTQHEPTASEDRVICRPTMADNARYIWAGCAVAILLPIPIYLLLSGLPSVRTDLIQLLLLMYYVLLFPFLLAWSLIAGTLTDIEASPEGIHWGKKRFVGWEDVTDYYDILTASRNDPKVVRQSAYVETRNGRIRFDLDNWRGGSDLRDYVAAHATSAKAKGWGILRQRPEDYPITCHYDTGFHRHAPRVLRELHGITLAAVVMYFGWRWLSTHTLPGWGWLLTPTGLFLLGKQAFLWMLYPTYRETYRRLEDRITITTDGLIFETSTRLTIVRWDEIMDFYVAWFGDYRYVIETEHGMFDFLATLHENELLQKTLLHCATRAGQTIWRTRMIMPKRRNTRTIQVSD